MHELRPSERGLTRVLVGVALLLNAANAWAIAGYPNIRSPWLLLGLERNPSTWFSAVLLCGTGLAAWLVGRGRADARWWSLVAVVLVVMSLDEVSGFHEELSDLPGMPEVGPRYWVLPALVVAAALGVKLLPWVLRLEPHLRAALVVGGAVYLIGAAGFESIAGDWQLEHGRDRMFWILSSVEENLELLGVGIVAHRLVAHLRSIGARLALLVPGDELVDDRLG